MRKLVQFVGIPGVGKSYLFKNIGVEGVNYIEFGTEFKKWITRRNGFDREIIVPEAPKEFIREFLDGIINHKQPAVFTSHITYFDGRQFVYDEELELYTSSAGYIFVYANPNEIAQRRIRDNDRGVKQREIESLEHIARHQQASLELVNRFSSVLGSKVLRIESKPSLELENLERIRGFVREALL